MSLKLLFIQLNEINFDLVDKYLSTSKKSKFTNLRTIKNTYQSFDIYLQHKYQKIDKYF